MDAREPGSRAGWRSGFGPDERIQRVRPPESFDYIHNPHRGTATFQRFNGDPVEGESRWNDREGPFAFQPFMGDPESLVNDRYPRSTVAYCRWAWGDIEPEKGRFRWDAVDGALQAARARGQTLQARIQPYLGKCAPPDWYWKTGAPRLPSAPASPLVEPDHNDPRYAEHWGDVIRAFGARYDGHPDLESFDVAYGGSCGECGGNTTPDTAARLVDIYAAGFKVTTLLSMLGTHGCAHAAGFGRPCGWRADCFGDLRADGKGMVPDRQCWNHMYDEYPRELFRNGVQDAWMRAPVTMETCWTVLYWQAKGWDIDWILEQGLKYHLSVFMPKSSRIPEAWKEKIDAFDRRLGYRFVLRQALLPLEAKTGARITAEVWMDNVGVAPIYRPYRLALRFRQGDVAAVVPFAADPRAWLPGYAWFSEELTLPAGLRRGEVAVDVGMIDPLTNHVRVRLAIEGPCDRGWHALTHMDIL